MGLVGNYSVEMSRTRGRHSSGRRVRWVTIKPGAETWARFENGKCKICRRTIKLRDHIVGVWIDGLGHEWDCKTKCGAAPEYFENEDGDTERRPCLHYNELNWVH